MKAFNDLGYVEGKNIRLHHRFPNENPDRFRALAQELVDEKPDVTIDIVVLGAVELRKRTDTIPIVFVIVADPVGFGLVKSLPRPGGNLTGFTPDNSAQGGKWVELEGGRAAYRARGAAVQPGNSRAAPILHAFHSSRRIVPCHSDK